MNTIPYGIIGNGSVASHFAKYLELLEIPFIIWSRKNDSIPPDKKLKDCRTIIILISDDSIDSFINSNPSLSKKTLIHFSGSLITSKAIGFHPLMTFSKDLYTLEEYKTIPFIGSKEKGEFTKYFPELKNRYYVINESQKPLYHALCVLSGNLTTLLWQKTVSDFESKLDLPSEVLEPYLTQVFKNIKSNPQKALTGPIKRGDKKTMKSNKRALKSKTWSSIYRLFNRAYQKELK